MLAHTSTQIPIRAGIGSSTLWQCSNIHSPPSRSRSSISKVCTSIPPQIWQLNQSGFGPIGNPVAAPHHRQHALMYRSATCSPTLPANQMRSPDQTQPAPSPACDAHNASGSRPTMPDIGNPQIDLHAASSFASMATQLQSDAMATSVIKGQHHE